MPTRLEHLHGRGPTLPAWVPAWWKRTTSAIWSPTVKDGIERRHRFLKHHRDAGLPRTGVHPDFSLERHEVLAVEEPESRCPVRCVRAAARSRKNGKRGHRLAASRLADETDRLARSDLERDAVHGAGNGALAVEIGAQVLDPEERRRFSHSARAGAWEARAARPNSSSIAASGIGRSR